ncbi:MAG: tandem-95 repeat protein [Propionibacteriaceae bacterium]|jgi:hypothetical protein|nr:tandem-95 repeat protein [Propionibacteriaceae bacterium]
MTVVGSTPVVLDREAGTLYLGTTKSVAVQLGDDESVDSVALQQVSAASSAVVYSTTAAVITQPLDGGAPAVVDASVPGGVAAAPVQLGGCTYAVWSGTGAMVRDCAGEASDTAEVVPGADAKQELRFRVNWGHIVLNQIESGSVWLVSDRIQKVDNWDSMMEGNNGQQNQDSTQELDENEKPDRTADNHPPQAADDTFGARAGQSVLLPVVENDVDEDGDLLTVELVGPAPADWGLSLVYSNSVFQANVPATATGSVSFQYKVSDGRGGEDTATVTVEIHPESENAPPAAVRATTLTVTSGHRVTYNVLTNWRDPDGDTIFLTGASGSPEDLTTPVQDGTLTFQDGGVTTGVKTVTVSVSDGTSTATGEVLVNVLPSANRPPVPVPDLVSGTVDTPIEIRPLVNDTDPDGNELRLTAVEGGEPDCVLTRELSQGYVTAVCGKPGSVYLTYTVTDGPSANVESWIRVVVSPPAASDTPPIAVPDTVLLSPGQDAYVNPLENDINPLGYPLVLTSLDAGADLPVSVSVINYERVKVTPNGDFTTPVTLTYTISNGKGYASSRITVVPVPAPDKILSPTAVDDTVTVRAGDIATVPVLANDTQPNGIALRLRPDLAQVPNPDTEALVFTSGNNVRVHARAEGTYTVLYEVENTKGSAEPDTGRLTVYVTPPDDGTNSAPKPKDVTARTVAGRPVAISVPLDGIDPNGDFVRLVGLGSAPLEGVITQVTGTGFVYKPGPTSDGGDDFTYVVADRLGATATGRVAIGIAPASNENHPPIAVTDYAEARPGGLVTIPVTANDSDPDSDGCCYLTADSVTSDSFTGQTRGDVVIVTAPAEPGSYWGTYEITDEFYQAATGVITLNVADDVPLAKPVAGDDVVSTVDALTNTSMTLAVRNNDQDPDGDVEQDTVTVTDPTVTVAGGDVTVPITDELQIIDYYLTDPDGLVGHGFITVPGVAGIPPTYNPAAVGFEVPAGESRTFALKDQVLVRPNREPRVTTAAGVTAWNGTATAASVTEVTFTAPENYQGPAAVSVEITDGASLEDDTGLTAVVTIPVTVTPPPDVAVPPNQPPVLASTSLDVEAGQSATVDLGPLTTNPEATDPLTYAIAGAPGAGGVTAAMTGSVLTVTAALTVPRGTQDTVTVQVDDGTNPPVTGQVRLQVVASKKPLPQAMDDRVPNANQGKTVCVPVTANDMNPFPGEPLTVGSAAGESGAGGTAQPGCGDGGVNVTPGPTFLGEMVVSYVLQDATHDTARQATGRIYLTVRGRPDPPTGLHLDSVGDKQAILSWSPPNNNGAPISAYTVTATPGAPGYPKQCTTTTCILTGLTNNVTYKFTVTATNEVGTSDPSLASDDARPDAIPYPVAAPTLRFGDKSLTLTWVATGSPGSPVTSYDLQISPPPSSGRAQVNTGSAGTTYVWSGLTNGTEYKVQICPRNLAPGVCEPAAQWSAPSAGETPAGLPDAPAKPTWTRLNPVGTEGQVQVCWTKPFENGAAITKYTLKSSTGNTYTVTPGTGAQTCQTTTLPTSTTDYTFTVAAVNKAGQGAFSAASDGFRSTIPPGAVTGLSAADGNAACAVTGSAAALNGAKSSEVIYHWQTNGGSGTWGTNPSGTATGLINSGNAQTITVWASTSVQGYGQDGPKSTVSCNPYGPPNKPGASASKSGNADAWEVTLGWTIPATNGRSITVQTQIDGGGWETRTSNGSVDVGNGWGQTHSINVKSCDSAGQCSTNSASATGNSQPPPRYWIWVNQNKCLSAAQAGGSYSGGCQAQVSFNKYALTDNGTYTVVVTFTQPNGNSGRDQGNRTVGRVANGDGFLVAPGYNGYVNIGDKVTIEVVGQVTVSGYVHDDWSVW